MNPTFLFVLVPIHFNKEPNTLLVLDGSRWFWELSIKNSILLPQLCYPHSGTPKNPEPPLRAQQEKITNWFVYLIVQVKVVKLAVGPEVLSVVIQGEVDVPPVALDDHWVPVVVVQQTPAGHSGVTLDGSMLVAAFTEPHISLMYPDQALVLIVLTNTSYRVSTLLIPYYRILYHTDTHCMYIYIW